MAGVRSGRSSRFVGLRWSVPLWLVGLLAFLGESGWAQAQNRPGQKFLPDWSGQADKLLDTAADHAKDRQWSEAINIYQRVIDQFEGKVAKLPSDAIGADASGDFVLYVDERRFCHAAIAHLPPEAREIYRNRIDGLAERSRSASPRC
jgi:hypothetical protein